MREAQRVIWDNLMGSMIKSPVCSMRTGITVEKGGKFKVASGPGTKVCSEIAKVNKGQHASMGLPIGPGTSTE